MPRNSTPPIQFQSDDRPEIRLQKLRRLAEAVAALDRTAETSASTPSTPSEITVTGPALLGRLSGTGAPLSLAGAQATTLLSTFTAGAKGLAPAPGTATGTRFLRDDGGWSPVTIAPNTLLHADLAGLLADDHPQYVLRSILTTDGDLFVRAGGAVDRLGIGTDNQMLRVNGTAPNWETISPVLTLGTDLAGNTTFTDLTSATLNATIVNDAVTDAKLRDSVGLSVIGRAANTTGDPADIVGTDGQILRVSGTTLGFGSILSTSISDFVEAAQDAVGGALTDSGRIDFTYNDGADTITADIVLASVNTAYLTDDAVTDPKLRNSAALSVIGRSANSTGDPADIVAANDGEVLRRSGTTLGFGTLATAGLADDSVTNAKLANMAQSTIKGRAEGAGTGDPTDLTPGQVTAIIDGEAVTWSALHTFAANLLLESANPRLLVQETGLAADTGMWDLNFDGGSFAVRTRTDADGTGVPLMTATRPSGTQPLRLFIGALDADLAGFSTTAGNVLNYGVVFSAFDLTRNANFVLVSSQRPLFNMLKYQGTLTSPTQIVNNTALHAFQFSCYNADNAAIATTVDITCTSTENWSTTAQGTRMDLRTTPNGTTTRTIALRLAESQCQLLDGSAASPSTTYQNDLDTGRYRIGANNEGISTGGTLRWDIDTARILTTLPQRGPDGSAAAPTYSFSGVTTKGMYSVGTNQVGLAANSALQFEVGDGYSDQPTQARRSGDISPAQLTANTDNWNPTGLATASVIRASTDASRNLTGIAGGVDGRELYLINVGTQPLVLVNDATSTAANRFLLASGTNTTLQAGGAAHLWYDGTSSRWRQIGRVA